MLAPLPELPIIDIIGQGAIVKKCIYYLFRLDSHVSIIWSKSHHMSTQEPKTKRFKRRTQQLSSYPVIPANLVIVH